MATRRETLVRAALVAAVTASLGLFAAGGEPPPEPLARAGAGAELNERTAPPAEGREALRVDLLQRSAQETAARDVFAAHSWYRPPPPPPAQKLEPPPPPPPAAPPLPFTFLGTFESADGKPVFYLVEGDKVHAVSEGEVVNGVWRIQGVSVDAIVLMYLPLSLPQTLALGNPR